MADRRFRAHRMTTGAVTGCVAVLVLAGCATVPSAQMATSGGPAAATVSASASSGAGAPGNTPDQRSLATTSAHHRSGAVTVGGLNRTWRLYVPASASGTAQVPLLIALHGGGGSGTHFERVSGLDTIADTEGFIVAYPDGIRPAGGGVSTWNAGECCGHAAAAGVDDVGFIRALIDAVSAEYRIDARRVYVTGESNGAMLGYRLACQSGDTIAAVAVQSGTLESAPCHPPSLVSLLGIHGADDTHVPLAGGLGSGLAGADYTPPLVAAATVAAGDGCHGAPTVAPDPALPGASLHTWTGCPPGIAVQLAVVSGAGHAWMPTTPTAVWAFLSAHPRPTH